ncbi:MAG: xanthine dehydrogenase family protein subunit M [Acidimicrobiales bacterium]|jgi:carbon-monoxide dehydrogenase medium subunit|nr:xanthine dehydrogenase family protein subunit M [Acidimicrobiales bacterium]
MKYAAPTTVDEAIGLLAGDADAQVFAGATDLIPQIRSGRPKPFTLVDLKKIDRLVGASESGGTWTVGAATPTSTLTGNASFAGAFPGLSEASGLIGSDQIQNRSSWGGNLCNASPAADSVPALFACGARAVVAGSGGERTVPVDEIVTGPGQTSLANGEFIVEFEVDTPPANTADAYLRLIPRTEMDIAVVGAAVRVTMDGDTCTDASVVIGAVAPTVLRVPDAEAALVGSTLDDATLEAVAAAASAACNPIDDKRGTIEYRTQVAGVLAKRSAKIAAERANS